MDIVLIPGFWLDASLRQEVTSVLPAAGTRRIQSRFRAGIHGRPPLGGGQRTSSSMPAVDRPVTAFASATSRGGRSPEGVTAPGSDIPSLSGPRIMRAEKSLKEFRKTCWITLRGP